ncbi:FAD-dependent oxidoreductase [Micromonospora sp. NBC_01813]|uniref:FAD-dependent oxidoreductase n=1 Tax=Micromonospora sp. NBC_01813 TaxID=2975988 RepID=UPI002DDB67D1|nr:FAD-dependent oxidoreductase [Micromonospora sp. NBC_01813]WSA10065.1 FAD-dependent oxidoreductase [Micromonospora sp. NBC_01813]
MTAAGDPTPTVDVLVVGGGLAGWCAAVRAQQAGATVVVVERARRRPGWGNSVLSGGALHAALRDPRTDPGQLRAAVRELTDGRADEAVLRTWSERLRPTLEWLTAHGAHLVTDGDAAHRARVFAPVRRTEPGRRYAGFGVRQFLSGLAREFIGAGGTVRQPARARRLRPGPSGGWLVGLDLPTAATEWIPTRTVVLADGGFQADPVLLRRGLGTDQVLLRGAGTATGDGLRMGLSAGGVLVEGAGFYGHLLARQARWDRRLWPYPILDPLASVGIVVGPDGRRLVDESQHGVTTTNAVARSGHPDRCWLIFDDVAWRTDGLIGAPAPNPYLLDCDATVLVAEDPETLAGLAGLDPAGLAATLTEVTAAPGGASPPRGGRPKVVAPPLRAVPLVAGVTFTLGGLQVDGRARLRDAAGEAIGGLYAAGGTMGGLHGGPRAGYAGGLLEAAVFGLVAGETAAGPAG